MHEFYVLIRDAQGAVTRALLEQFILGLPQEIQRDLMSKGEHRRDEFFARWRRWYKIVYRRVTGVKQFLPDDYQLKLRKFNGILRSLYFEKRHKIFFCTFRTKNYNCSVPNFPARFIQCQIVPPRHTPLP